MRNVLRLLAVVAALATLSPMALAAEDRQTAGDKPVEAAPEAANAAQSMKELLEGGFEIKDFAIVPREIVKRGGSTTNVDAVMILLQRGPEVANCYVTYDGFAAGTYYNGSVPICTVLK